MRSVRSGEVADCDVLPVGNGTGRRSSAQGAAGEAFEIHGSRGFHSPARIAAERQRQDRPPYIDGASHSGIMSLPGRVTNLFLPEPEVQALIQRGQIEALASD